MTTLDSASISEDTGEAGPGAASARPAVAGEDRLYLVGEHTSVLVHEGHRIPRELLTVEHVPAVLVDGVYVPRPKGGRK